MNILAIDTSSRHGSAALRTSKGQLFTRSGEGELNYSIRLFRWLDEIREKSGLSKGFRELDAVAVTSGPGSFTGLRVGVASAKGIAMGAGCQLIPVPTLEAMAWAAVEGGVLRRPVLLAGRGEVYTALYRIKSDNIQVLESERVVKPEELLSRCNEENSYIFGNGVSLLNESIAAKDRGKFHLADLHPELATTMVDLTLRFVQQKPEAGKYTVNIRYIRRAASRSSSV